MTTWNQGDLFIAKIVSQIHPEFKQKGLVTVLFRNLAINDNYFLQCIDGAFVGDKDVVEVNSGSVVFTRDSVLEVSEVENYLQEKSKLLLDALSRHKQWGRADGPNLMAEHETLE